MGILQQKWWRKQWLPTFFHCECHKCTCYSMARLQCNIWLLRQVTKTDISCCKESGDVVSINNTTSLHEQSWGCMLHSTGAPVKELKWRSSHSASTSESPHLPSEHWLRATVAWEVTNRLVGAELEREIVNLWKELENEDDSKRQCTVNSTELLNIASTQEQYSQVIGVHHD